MNKGALSPDKKTLAFFVLFCSVILSRNFLETAVVSKRFFLTYFTIFHHFFWYNFIFLWYCICFRYIAGMKREKLPYLMLGAPLVLIPVIYSAVTGLRLQTGYMSGIPLSEIIFHIATLNYFYPENRSFFIELLILGLFIAALSYFISKSVLKSIINLFFAFYGSFFIGGLHLFGVVPTKAYIKLDSLLLNHQLLALIYYFFTVAAIGVLFLPEIKSELNFKALPKYIAFYIPVMLIYYLILVYFFFSRLDAVPGLLDQLLLFLPFLSMACFLPVMINRNLLSGYRLIPAFYFFAGAAIFAGIIIGLR